MRGSRVPSVSWSLVSTHPFAGVVALDGPSGTGKSTVARGLATRLGARYLDTGAMYRAATLAVLRAGVDSGRCRRRGRRGSARRESTSPPTRPPRTCASTATRSTHEIRSPEVTAAVSAVSAVPDVRTQLVAAQRALIERRTRSSSRAATSASVVWPQAWPKVFLTASAETRARRRAGEFGAADEPSVAAVAEDIARRDRLDSTRATSPLAQAADAARARHHRAGHR